MNKKDDFALVRKPSSAVEKAAPGAKRILTGMIADTLALAKPVIDVAELEKWFQNGKKYENQQGVTHDYAEAVKSYRMAAEQNYAKAQFSLGWCYRDGRGVEKDDMEAIKWWRRAAENNDADAQDNLGLCYRNGRGVEKNYAEAVKWFRKAAIQGHEPGIYWLGCCYEQGQGVPQDIVEAYKLFKLAADFEFFKNPLDGLNRIVPQMSAVEIAEGESRYRELRRQKNLIK
jgi:hypothetical protein